LSQFFNNFTLRKIHTLEYSIKDIENLTNIKAHTIRIWEKRYGIIKLDRSDTNIRSYSEEELRKLLNISILINNGIKISHIAAYSPNEIREKAFFLLQNINDTESHIKNLVIAMVELNESKFEKILSKSIINLGFEKTMMNLVYPFLAHIGVLWQTGSINPAQEHFISNLVRQKLISSIDSIDFKENQNAKKFMLFLPEGEWHELGLLFYYYILKVRGHQVLYLGQSTPLNSLMKSAEIWPVNFLVLFAISSFSVASYSNYLIELSANFKSSKIIVAGDQLKLNTEKFPSNVIGILDAIEFIRIIDEIS
jgi:MerR family transcriptional regulator, light-induced transcriptional regulator